MSALITQPRKEYYIALFCCYAARTPDKEVQQTGQTPAELAGTLAYKFFRLVQPQTGALTVSARTGEVTVSEFHNHAATQDDATSALDAALARFVAAPAYQEARTRFLQLFPDTDNLPDAEMPPQTREHELSFIIDNAGSVGDAQPQHLSQQEWDAAVTYCTLRGQAKEMPKGSTDKIKFGKFIYHYSKGELTILNRYSKADGDRGQITSRRRHKSYDGVILYKGDLL